jgi:hypothetical protein
MSWAMQIHIENRGWFDVTPTLSNKPYSYDTREEAEKMLSICYPDQLREERLGGPQVVRVLEVQT